MDFPLSLSLSLSFVTLEKIINNTMVREIFAEIHRFITNICAAVALGEIRRFSTFERTERNLLFKKSSVSWFTRSFLYSPGGGGYKGRASRPRARAGRFATGETFPGKRLRCWHIHSSISLNSLVALLGLYSSLKRYFPNTTAPGQNFVIKLLGESKINYSDRTYF